MSDAGRAVSVSGESAPESMQVSDCVIDLRPDSRSPLGEFKATLVAHVKAAELIDKVDEPELIGQMLIVSSVAATETYLREVLASLLTHCEVAQSYVRSEMVQYANVMAYTPDNVALALLDGVLFSSQGVIEKQLGRLVKYDSRGDAELQAAIRAFEHACQCRHSAAHARGRLDVRALEHLGIKTRGGGRYELLVGRALVERVFAACNHLVHTFNDSLYSLTLNRWIDAGLLSLTTEDAEADQKVMDRLLQIFSHLAEDERRDFGLATLASIRAESS